MRHPPSRPSRRAVKHQLAVAAFMSSPLGQGEAPVAPEVVKRGPQPEGETHKEVAAWRNTKPGLLLERNKRRLAIPVGYHKAIMLGWDCDGSPDWVGYESVLITPAMLNKRVAVFVGLEAKRAKGGVVSDDQQTFLDAARDAGAIVGVVRSFEDCEDARARWLQKVQADER